MKGKSFHLAVTTKTARRTWSHVDPEDMRKLLADGLQPRQAMAVRRHLRSCLECSLLAGRVAAIQDINLETIS